MIEKLITLLAAAVKKVDKGVVFILEERFLDPHFTLPRDLYGAIDTALRRARC